MEPVTRLSYYNEASRGKLCGIEFHRANLAASWPDAQARETTPLACTLGKHGDYRDELADLMP
jgi:hypothetical protein